MPLELFHPHERRLVEVRQLIGTASPPAQPSPAGDRHEAEESLRVAMVRLLPRALESDEACTELLTALEGLWSMARNDIRALDAWHNGYEVAITRGLDPRSRKVRTFLGKYATLLECWVAASA